MIYLIQTTRQV